MAAHWERDHCRVCDEPLETNDERNMGVHEECEALLPLGRIG